MRVMRLAALLLLRFASRLERVKALLGHPFGHGMRVLDREIVGEFLRERVAEAIVVCGILAGRPHHPKLRI